MTSGPLHQYSSAPLEILLVEDNPGDIRLIEEAFAELESDTTLQTVANGYDAVAHLKQQGTVASPSLPDLAMIDLDLPGKNGCEVLETIREDPQLRPLPVIILTSSTAAEDVTQCYNSCANAYIQKPSSLDGYISVMETIEQFWFQHAELPSVPP